jgi:hypothetical protein
VLLLLLLAGRTTQLLLISRTKAGEAATRRTTAESDKADLKKNTWCVPWPEISSSLSLICHLSCQPSHSWGRKQPPTPEPGSSHPSFISDR